MVTVDELPEFCYMLRHMMASKLKHTEVEVNTPSDREVPWMNRPMGRWGLGIGGGTRHADVTIEHVRSVTRLWLKNEN